MIERSEDFSDQLTEFLKMGGLQALEEIQTTTKSGKVEKEAYLIIGWFEENFTIKDNIVV